MTEVGVQIKRDGFGPSTVRRSILLAVVAIAAVVIGLQSVNAQNSLAPPNPTTYCDQPEVIPIATVIDGEATEATGVVTARGGTVSLRDGRAVIRLPDPGSRVQVQLDEPLFHTQWVLGQVDRNDSVRVDITAGGAVQAVGAVSTFGSFGGLDAADGSGLTAIGVGDGGTGQIDVHVGADVLLFSNNGSSAVELVGASGCPAVVVDEVVRTPPTWDRESQRFVARYSVTVQPNLPTQGALAQITRQWDTRNLTPTAVRSINDLMLDFDARSPGFGGAEITRWDAPPLFDDHVNPAFDGLTNTALFTRPRRLVSPVPQTFTFDVAYEPDFNDPVWERGIGAPSPRFGVEGTVAGLPFRSIVRVGVDSDGSTPPRLTSLQQQGFIPPASALGVRHRMALAPVSRADGSVTLSEFVTITNSGQTDLDGVGAEYDLTSMYGPGTEISFASGSGSDACQSTPNGDWDGGQGQNPLIELQRPLRVGQTCTVTIRATVVPGIIPSEFGSSYQASVVVRGRSGIREVTGHTSVDVDVTQRAEFSTDFSPIAVENGRDGSYLLTGTVMIGNAGDQNLENVALTLDMTSSDGVGPVPRQVRVEKLQGEPGCSTTVPPTRSLTGFVVVDGNLDLAPAQQCVFEFALRTVPGPNLQGWVVSSTLAGASSRRQPVSAAATSEPVTIRQSPSLAIDTTTSEPINNTDGTYTFDVDHVVTNTGDVPLQEVVVSDSLLADTSESVVSYRLTSSTCADVAARSLLLPDRQATCTVQRVATVRPGAHTTGWTIESEASGLSVSDRSIVGSTTSAPFDFVSEPAVTATFDLREVTKVSRESFQFVFDTTFSNTGDIILDGVNGSLDLRQAFGDLDFQVDWLTSRNLSTLEYYDGDEAMQLLAGDDVMVVGAQRSLRLAVTVESIANPGPFEFRLRARAGTPSGAVVLDTPASIERAVPIVEVVDRRISQTNLSDGTYEIVHTVWVQNVGGTPLSETRVTTDFTHVFRNVTVGAPTVVDQCSALPLDLKSICTVVTTARIRPGELIGPYPVATEVAGVDDAGVDASVRPETAATHHEAKTRAPLTITEAPSVSLLIAVSEAVNNGDASYGLKYTVDVTNDGDVPLNAVSVSDGVADTFGDRVAVNRVVVDTCSAVGRRTPLPVGSSCQVVHDAIIVPSSELGPWATKFSATGRSPADALVSSNGTAADVRFRESVGVSGETRLGLERNNADGTYILSSAIAMRNTSDVPLVSVDVDTGTDVFADRMIGGQTLLDTCGEVSRRNPLPPGSSCERQAEVVIEPGSDLGPWVITSTMMGSSPSGRAASSNATSSGLTIVERPGLLVEPIVASVENNGDGSFRVVSTIDVTNIGEVQLRDLQLGASLDDAFMEAGYRVEGVISRDFQVNEQFLAGDSTFLLAEGEALWPGASGRITLVTRVEPDTAVGPFIARIESTATAPSAAAVRFSPLLTIDLPAIDLAILSQLVINNGDGSYVVETMYDVHNRGTTRLDDLRVLEDLSETYQTATARLGSVQSDTLQTVDPVQRGRSDDLVVRGQSLEVGDSAQITSQVTVVPGNALGPFRTKALAVATSPTETSLATTANHDDDIVFVETPALRVEQRLVRRPVWNDNGRFDVTFAIDVINDGDVEVRRVQIREDMLEALGGGSTIIVRNVRSSTLTPNDRFDALGRPPADLESDPDATRPTRDVGDTRILNGWDTLAAGSSGTVEIDMTIVPENRGTYNTRVVASALSPAGIGLGTENEIEASTLTRLTVQGELALAKRILGEPRVRPDGSVEVTYELFIENAGPFPLNDVEVHDQLSQAFGVGSTFLTSRVRTDANSSCTGFASSTYDGGAIDPVLLSGVELAPSETCLVQYDAVVIPQKNFPGPFRSSAFAIATDPFGGTVIDDSTDGVNPDPDNNQEPGDNDVATSLRISPPEPTVSVAMEATAIVPDEEWFDVTYRITLRNTGDIDVINPRVAVDLDDQWSDEFSVEEITSEKLAINSAYDGRRDVRLISSRNTLRAEEDATVWLTVSTNTQPGGALELDISFDAASVADGSRTTADTGGTASLRVILSDSGGGGWSFSNRSSEEKWMILLGVGALLLIAFVIGRNALTRVRETRWLRSYLESDHVPPLRHQSPIIDLRDDEDVDGPDPTHAVPRHARHHRAEHGQPKRRLRSLGRTGPTSDETRSFKPRS